LPDKAIDALDEAGSRVQYQHWKSLKKILDLERQLEDIRELKNVVVKKNNEEAAKLRDENASKRFSYCTRAGRRC
jgi:ATP-dependent Clp protease ATP-binding subunit ClpC